MSLITATEGYNTGNILLGVMGDPIIQSKSPIMHEAALQALGIPGAYVPLHILQRIWRMQCKRFARLDSVA